MAAPEFLGRVPGPVSAYCGPNGAGWEIATNHCGSTACLSPPTRAPY